MTLKEIAKEANVSISTVSRVINNAGTKAASPEVQERIWEIVRRTGYSPNNAARSLKLGNNTDLSDTTPKSIVCIYARPHTDIADPFFSLIAKSIELEAIKSRYFIHASLRGSDLSKPEISRQLIEHPVDGIILLGRYDRDILSFISKYYKNVIYTGLYPMPFDFDQVICDSGEIVETAISYLKSLGHTQIGYIGEQDNEVRFSSYKKALISQGLTFSQSNTVNAKQTSEGGYEGMKTLARQADDLSAILCANDRTAVGVIHALKKLGFSIPEDISVISIDDIEIAQHLSPMLTTVHVPTAALGKIAFRTLVDRINNGHRLPQKIYLPYYIAKRESCAPLNRDRKTFSDYKRNH
jgi:DNA-binding LacI/PurR family transcriptional regulator